MLELIELLTPLVGPVSLRLDAGRCATISGPSGSGKSRLLRAIADLDPHEGEVRLDSAPCSATPPPLWRRQVQLLPAEPQWWAPSVGDHFPEAGEPQSGEDDSFDPKTPGSRIASTDQTNPPPLIPVPSLLGLPDEVFAWPVERLSSGERQRLALLRALHRRPRVLLLDEPTANLDEDNTARVEHLVDGYRREHGAIVIWVSHDVAQRTRVGDIHYRIANGRILPAGSTAGTVA